MNETLLYQWEEELTRRFPSLNSWQVQNVALFTQGVVEAESCQQAEISRKIVSGERVESAMRRLRRFISNPRIDLAALSADWTSWVIDAYVGEKAILLVDETKLNDRFGVMVVGLAWEGRCIPLAWRCYEANNAAAYPAEGQVAMIEGLLKQVKAGLPDDYRVLVLADRGIGTSPALCCAVAQLGWHYLFRVTCQTKVVTDQGDYTIAQMVQPGQVWYANGEVFKQRGRIPAHAYALWSEGYDEPWALVSNDPALSGFEYAHRNWQEQSFRDLKSGGWNWEISRVRHPDRMARLFLLLVIAYGWVLALGCHAVAAGRARAMHRPAGQPPRRVWSLFKEGLTFFVEVVRRQGLFLNLLFSPDTRFI